MSIALIFKIISFFRKYLKEHKSEFILLIIVLVCFLTITIMTFRLSHRKNQIKKLEVEIEKLEITNEYLSLEVLNISNTLYVKNNFSNSTIKVITLTNDLVLIEEDLYIRDNFMFDFFTTFSIFSNQKLINREEL